MDEFGSIFLQIVEQMKTSGHLSVEEAENLRLHYMAYIGELSQKNASVASQRSKPAAYEFEKAPNIAPPEKKTPTKDYIRERNLSWILNIGVVLILISGVIFGTTTWGLLGSFGRVALLFCVSLLFFGVSVLAGSLLKLRRTSDAFWILGSLMLPVSLLSIGYLRLFGDYFSFFGHGRYIFALICGFVCMPEFVYSAHKFKSRVFSWLTLIDLSLCFTFFAASFYFNAPLFYLLLFGFSGVLIAAKSLLRNFAALSLFLREAWLFIQLNLIITSLFAVFSYNSAYLYSINIIAAAILFFALSARERLFGYDYVAALLFNLGLVMLARDFHNTGVLYLMIAAAGVIFTCAAVAMRGDGKKSSRFNLIGSVTAGIGSVYIALAMLVYGQKGGYMLVGLIALCVMLGDMIYLSIRNKIQFLGAVVPLFAFVTLYQGLAVIEHYWVFPYDKAYLLAMSVVIFAAFYIFNNIKSFRAAKISGAMIALLNLVILFFICIYPRPLLISLPLIGLVFTAMLYVIYIKTGSKGLKRLFSCCMPAALILSLCLLRYAYSLNAVPPLPFYFYSAFAVFLLSFAAVGRLRDLKKPLCYCSLITMAVFFVIILPLELIPSLKNAADFAGAGAFIYTSVFALAAGAGIFSLVITDRRAEKCFLLQSTLFVMTMYLLWINRLININYRLSLGRYVFYAAGFLALAACALIKGRDLKRQICFFSCAIAVLLVFVSLFNGSMNRYEYAAAAVYASLLCLEMALCGLDMLALLPLLLLSNANRVLFTVLLKSGVVCLLPGVLWAGAMIFAGSRRHKFVFSRKIIDWFAPVALLNILILPYHYTDIVFPHLSVIVPGCLAAGWFLFYRRRLFEGGVSWGSSLFAASLLLPYYSLFSSFVLPSYVSYELIWLPVVILTVIILKWIFKGTKTEFTKTAEYLIPSLCYLGLLIHLIYSDSMIEAVVIISFAIASLLYGSIFKTKSALIMGGAVTIAGTVLKTKVFWLNIQWWVYLLAAGVILVTFAGVNEYLKNKNASGLQQRTAKWLERFREWN